MIIFQAPEGKRIILRLLGIVLHADRCTCFGYDHIVVNSYGNKNYYWSAIRCRTLYNGATFTRYSSRNLLNFYFRGKSSGRNKFFFGYATVL